MHRGIELGEAMLASLVGHAQTRVLGFNEASLLRALLVAAAAPFRFLLTTPVAVVLNRRFKRAKRLPNLFDVDAVRGWRGTFLRSKNVLRDINFARRELESARDSRDAPKT